MRYPLILFLFVSFLVPGIFPAQDIFEAARKGDIRKITSLYKIKPDTLNAKNESGFTPLIIAVYRNQKDAAVFLLEHGADINAGSPEGPAIMAAAYKNNFEMAALLIEHKANLNVQNDDGITPLMFAAMGNQDKLAALLLAHGANKQTLSRSGHTALSYAKLYNCQEVIKLLSE